MTDDDTHDEWRALNEPPDSFAEVADRFIATADRCIVILQQILDRLDSARTPRPRSQ